MVQDSTVVFPDSAGGRDCVCGADARGVAQVGGDGNVVISGNKKRGLPASFRSFYSDLTPLISRAAFCVG